MRRECITVVLVLALLPCAITGPFTWNPFSDDSRPLASEGEVSCSSDDGVRASSLTTRASFHSFWISSKRQACKRGDTGGWSTDADTILSSSRCNIRKIYKSWQSGGISAEVTISQIKYHTFNTNFWACIWYQMVWIYIRWSSGIPEVLWKGAGHHRRRKRQCPLPQSLSQGQHHVIRIQ